MKRFVAHSRIEATAEEVYNWHLRPGAFERLVPPWTRIETEGPDAVVANGSRRVLRIPVGPFRVPWVAVHDDVVPGRRFRDTQESGPFAIWRHTHRFEPDGDRGSRLIDEIGWAPPGGALGAALGGGFIEADLRRMFRHRHAITAGDLARHARYADRPRMTVAVTGASGLVGSALSAFLTTGGHRVRPVVRRIPSNEHEIGWDPVAGTTDRAAWEGVDAVVHLAGENISGGRWTDDFKNRVRESRVRGTRLVAETVAALDRKPSVVVSASAVGFYGARDDDGPLDESAAPGDGFLSETCVAWEEAMARAADAGIRVATPRIGVVLSGRGGALAKMLPPFRIGAGGVVGSGRQTMSWIALDDLVGVLHALLLDPRLEGPVNATAPTPVDNRTFTKTLANVMRRPAFVPMPAAVLRLALGEMADALLLTGADVRPASMQAAGFPFLHPELESVLRAELGRFEGPAADGPRFTTA